MKTVDLDAFLADFLKLKSQGRTIKIGEHTVTLEGEGAEDIALALEVTAFRLAAQSRKAA
jgi:hypothetical protein